ncbi:MAG: hypothetical protein KBD83_01355 [Gammaproteobacteria bacterium]|nr:hypothetical protein [Gammaproteobacteria bacterium]
MTFASNKKQILLIPGPAGAVEVLISSPAEPRAITCIVCHPHPVQGGTMHNKVVYTSGGEAQRVKLSRELSKRDAGQILQKYCS